MGIPPPEDGALVFREVNGEILALDNRSNQIHQLNSTASFIWRLCRDGVDEHETAVAFAAVFEVDDETARGDVADTVQRLRMLNLVG